jgi:hypothetical protein
MSRRNSRRRQQAMNARRRSVPTWARPAWRYFKPQRWGLCDFDTVFEMAVLGSVVRVDHPERERWLSRGPL